jgi:predicted negative regulator of RcsB-dependent stress response
MADNHVPANDDSRSDLGLIQSLADFAQACDRLRNGRSYAELRKAARPLSLPAATLSDLLNARTTPTRDTVRTFLLACGRHDDAAQRPWLAAWERVATAHQPRPAGAERVRQARPRLLGVHAAIQVPSATGELPAYVPRDLDADLRAALTAAAVQGGFVLLVGGSSVGKTRALHEAIQAHLSEWWLLHPAETPAIADHAIGPTPRTVLWLDELQRFLNHPAGLPAGTLRQLITAGTVVVATLWPDEYSMRTIRPLAGQPDPYANDRELLHLAHVIRVPDTLSPAERRRGETLAPTDQRLCIALDAIDAGFTQVLAAGPALIQHWEQAADCYGKAVITAALDARRVGAHHPATRDFLQAAAPAYLTQHQQATAPPDWLDRGFAYATTALHGATACLTPVPAGMGRIGGYTIADYLHQHVRRSRRTTLLPDLVWQALINHHHPDDVRRLANSAHRLDRPGDAIALYQRAAAGDEYDMRLACLLREQGRVDELRELAAAGDDYAAARLADVLREQGRVDELRELVAAGDDYAAGWLADVLREQGRVDELRELVAAGNTSAAGWLVEVLAEQGGVDELGERAAAGDGYAALRLADVLVERGHVEEALQLLRDRAANGDDYPANRQLIDLLVEQGSIDEALQVLRDRAAAGHGYAADWLPFMLVQYGHFDELRDRIAAGHERGLGLLTDALLDQSRVEEALEVLRAASSGYAIARLVNVLVERGRVEEALQVLRDCAANGDDYPANRRLAGVLVEQGRGEEALQVLRDCVMAGDGRAAAWLADVQVDVLVEQGHVDQALQVLRDHAAISDEYSVNRKLIDLLIKQGYIDELRARADAGDRYAADRLVDLLEKQGYADELRGEVVAGTAGAARALRNVLDNQR